MHRALKFENITYSLKEDDNKKWIFLANNANQDTSWWNEKNDYIKSFCSKVLIDYNDDLIKNSLYHSAFIGGRFNPPKSCTALYLSEHEYTACLEVSYHILNNNLHIIRHFKKLNEWSKTVYKKSLPSELNFKIFLFEVEVDVDVNKIFDFNKTEKLKDILKKIGYDRYVKTLNVNDIHEFVSGNDYHICRQISSSILSKDFIGIKYKSARLDGSNNFVFLNQGYIFKVTKKYALLDIIINPSTSLKPHEFIIHQDGKEIKKYQLPQIMNPVIRKNATKYFYPEQGNSDDYTKIVLQKFTN